VRAHEVPGLHFDVSSINIDLNLSKFIWKPTTPNGVSVFLILIIMGITATMDVWVSLPEIDKIGL
jgi:hypothetical protein